MYAMLGTLLSMLVLCGTASAQEPASLYPSKNVLLVDVVEVDDLYIKAAFEYLQQSAEATVVGASI